MNPFQMAVNATFDAFGVTATFTPNGGNSVAITVIAKRSDEIVGFGDTRIHAGTAIFEVRSSEVTNPRPGDRLAVNGADYLVQGEPVADRDRLVWTLDTHPA
ncbi:MAG: hypothetical protein HQL64_05880 [Magnetococcales bacterium]|nr:hypothetical protein [Magnetococcales bacterium]